MPHNLCLNRQCLGLVTRIECAIRPLAGGNGLWTLLCAAGWPDGQPTAIKVQGPFHGPAMAESVLQAIADNLVGQGYRESDDPSIWQLHMQAELRRVNANQGASSAAGNDRHSIIDVRPSGADLPVTARLCPGTTMTLCPPWSARPCCVYSRLVQLPL